MSVELQTRAAPPAVAGTWIAFLVMAFGAVGLMGVFATYAGPLPLQRALAREATLDAALLAAHAPDPRAALEALRPALDDSADAILPWRPDIDRRIATERVAMRARFSADAAALAVRLRWLVCLVTIMAAAFGVAVLHASRRSG
jgi:hypothetical protein